MLAVTTTVPGLRPRGVDKRRKRCVLMHAFFKADLTLPRPPTSTLAGLRSATSGPLTRPRTLHHASRPWLLVVVVLWRWEYLRPQGAAAIPTKVSSCVPPAVLFLLLSNLPTSTLTGHRRMAAGTRPWDEKRASGGGREVGRGIRFAEGWEGGQRGRQPGGQRKKETGGRAERMQRKHGHSSTAMGSAPVGGGGQAGVS